MTGARNRLLPAFVVSVAAHALLVVLIPGFTKPAAGFINPMTIVFSTGPEKAAGASAAVTVDNAPPDRSSVSTGREAHGESVSEDTGNTNLGPGTAGSPAYSRARSLFITELAALKTYPRAARENKIQGLVELSIRLDADGRLVRIDTARSSRSKILDEAARELVRRVLPFPHGLGGDFHFWVSIAYTIE